MSRTIEILISNWPRRRKSSQLRQSLLTILTMVTRWSRSSSKFYALIVQNLTGEFLRKIYAASGNLFSNSWSWQSFVSPSCHVFNYLFPLDVKNEIHLLSRFFCNSWLVCVFVFHLVWWLKRFWPYLMAFRSWISLQRLFFCIFCVFFSFRFPKVERSLCG